MSHRNAPKLVKEASMTDKGLPNAELALMELLWKFSRNTMPIFCIMFLIVFTYIIT